MRNMSFKLSIIIPCYNESGNIPELMKRLDEVLQTDLNIEFVIVNNGSTDESDSIFLKEFNKRSTKKYLYLALNENQGYGGGILAGLKVATGNILGWTHADLQTEPRDLIHGMDLFVAASSHVVVKGRRIGRDFFDQFFSRGMEVYSNLHLKTSLSDINAQPKIFSRVFYEDYLLNRAPTDFSLDLFLLYVAEKNEIDILDFPVNFLKREWGVAKGAGSNSISAKWKLMKRTIVFIHKLKFFHLSRDKAPESRR